jgi:hypothetical protein
MDFLQINQSLNRPSRIMSAAQPSIENRLSKGLFNKVMQSVEQSTLLVQSNSAREKDFGPLKTTLSVANRYKPQIVNPIMEEEHAIRSNKYNIQIGEFFKSKTKRLLQDHEINSHQTIIPSQIQSPLQVT